MVNVPRRPAVAHAIVELIAHGQDDVQTVRAHGRALDVAANYARRGEYSHVNVLVFEPTDVIYDTECVAIWRWKAFDPGFYRSPS